MLNLRRTQLQQSTSKITKLSGGLNEQVSNIEVRPGELIRCTNYLELEGSYTGYESIRGYEVYDGQALASSIAAVDDLDTARETQRALIGAVPGSGNVRGIHAYKDTLYATRNNSSNTALELYEATATGWSSPIASTLNPNGDCQFANYRFSLFNANQEVMLWVDGKNAPQIYNGSVVVPIVVPGIAAGVYPEKIGVWKNRLFLAYPDGHILFSEVGDPTGFDTATGNAGEIFIGGDVTSIIEAPGGVLTFFTKDTIKILYYGSTDSTFIFKLDEFSNTTGAITDTSQNLLGTIFFTDDQGLSSLSQVAEYGDFAAKSLGKKVQRTFKTNKERIAQSVVDRDAGRFFQFYTNSSGISEAFVYTFDKNRLKGTTKIKLNHKVTALAEEQLDGANVIFFGSTDGFVYKFQSGTSFNGEPIPTDFAVSFNHYGSPRQWKRFTRLAFEVLGDDGTALDVYTSYDYGTADLEQRNLSEEVVSGSGGVYGESFWGTAIRSSQEVGKLILYNTGFGANMSVRVKALSKYRLQHSIYNFLTDYTMSGTQL